MSTYWTLVEIEDDVDVVEIHMIQSKFVDGRVVYSGHEPTVLCECHPVYQPHTIPFYLHKRWA